MMARSFVRPLTGAVRGALDAHPQLLHVLTGPRQVGKTTIALDIERDWPGPTRYVAADELQPPSSEWIRSQWDLARATARASDEPPLLILDEVQKVPRWSEVVKALWDRERRERTPMRVLLLGSSALLLASGVTESLAGRFLLHRCPHWTYPECRAAFGWELARWLYFGGYPGAAALASDPRAWRGYVRDSLIEAVLARDVLSLERVTKPALLRHLFALACSYPAQALSFNKMLGQLQDAGNTTTLAHYLRLLESAYLVTGLDKFSVGQARSRGSSPKLVVWTNALVSAIATRAPDEARADGGWWGRLVENAVGAHLIAHLSPASHDVTWWRDGNDEVDYVVRAGARIWAVEVKSGRSPASGLTKFRQRHPRATTLIVGPGGLAFEEFFSMNPEALFE